MIESSVKVSSILEPTSAAQLVQRASQFKSRISIVSNEKTANAKSIMGIISLNLVSGNIVKVIVDGEDEHQVMPELELLLQNEAV